MITPLLFLPELHQNSQLFFDYPPFEFQSLFLVWFFGGSNCPPIQIIRQPRRRYTFDVSLSKIKYSNLSLLVVRYTLDYPPKSAANLLEKIQGFSKLPLVYWFSWKQNYATIFFLKKCKHPRIMYLLPPKQIRIRRKIGNFQWAEVKLN